MGECFEYLFCSGNVFEFFFFYDFVGVVEAYCVDLGFGEEEGEKFFVLFGNFAHFFEEFLVGKVACPKGACILECGVVAD